MKRPLNIALIGYGFMGRAHSNAYRQAGRFFDLEYEPVLQVACARDRGKLEAFAANWGWHSIDTDWERVVARDDVDLVDICAPNHVHHDIALAALEAGKMVACEKPLARDLDEARQMAAAAERAGQPTMVWFNYRRVPAVALARQIIGEGRVGRVYHYRARYLQDWTMNPDLPQGGQTLWRLQREQAGSGVTGDLLAHSIDLALWLAGRIDSVCAMAETFVEQRPLHDDPGRLAPVEVDDACAFLARFANGGMATFESTRYARGRKNQHTFEVNGEKGAVSFDLETPQDLEFYDHGDEGRLRGWRTIQVWDGEHPYMDRWWVPGCVIGYEHTFVHVVADFLRGLAANEKTCPDFADALAVQCACEAVLMSAGKGCWETVPAP